MVEDTIVKNKFYSYHLSSFGKVSAHDYLLIGIEMNHRFLSNPGPVLLIVEQSLKDSLQDEVAELKNDWQREGRLVYEMVVKKDKPVIEIRDSIKTYYKSKRGLSHILLLGHVPVPYSGNTAWDGHGNHTGAWPADVYYGVPRGIWTDYKINNSSPGRNQNKNIPGDGKFDQNKIPGKVEIAVGRIDFSNLPEFSDSEIELTRKYLDKLHLYKTGQIQPVERALIDDNFGYFRGEAFSQSGWRNFNVFFHPDSIFSKSEHGVDYFTDLSKRSYLWSYGCGGGNYRGANGIGKTKDYASNEVQTVFTMMFGSYFGDWDVQNSFLRAALASGTTLTNCWAGRPVWYMHEMAMGYTIGQAAKSTQNNVNSKYYTPGNFGSGGCHVSLLGDPTLRMYMISPPTRLSLQKTGIDVVATWSPSPDKEILGYRIYRKYENDEYVQLNDSIITDTSFVFPYEKKNGVYTVLVRAIKLQKTRMGSFYNLSLGAISQYFNTTSTENQKNSHFLHYYPNPVLNRLSIEGVHKGEQPLRLVFYNSKGQIVKTCQLASGTTEVDLSGLPSGTYNLIVFHRYTIVQSNQVIKL